ncbi:glucose-6-phosphate isomerase [Thermostilla marina]
MADTKSRLTYDPQAALAAGSAPAIERETGVLADDLTWLAPRLEAARDEVLADLELKKSGRPVPPEKDPLDARFMDLPERWLGEDRAKLDALKAAADKLAAEVDNVVVLGIGGSYMGARALFEACCHPYHNELPRDKRGSRPRIYFEGNNVDNDTVAGLLDLLATPEGDGRSKDWGIIVISKSGSTLETAVAFRVFAEALRNAVAQEVFAQRVLVVSSEGSRLWNLAAELGVSEANFFAFPDDVGGRFSVLSAVGLLPAAVMGLDLVALLEGARDMNADFAAKPAAENVVLQYVGVCHLMEQRRGARTRILSTWGARLEAVGLWYDQLLAESLGKNGQGALPLTVVNTRDLHSRGQQHQEGPRDKLITNLYAEMPSAKPVAVPKWDVDADKLNCLAGTEMRKFLEAARVGTNKAYAEDLRRTTDLAVEKLDEYAIGQIFQMLMLATVTEGRLIGINPYGQPGVEGYKRHMRRYLGLE